MSIEKVERNKRIFKLVHIKGKAQAQVARDFDLSKERVRQIYEKEVEKRGVKPVKKEAQFDVLVSVNVSIDTKKALRSMSEKTDQTMSDIVRSALYDYLKE